MKRILCFAAAVLGLFGLAGSGRAATIETTYYQLATTLSKLEAKEAVVRLDRAYEELDAFYSFVPVRKRAPEKHRAILFTNRADYLRAGGLPFSDGCYMIEARALYMLVNDKTDWSGVVHEAAHQYLREVVGEKFPTWFDEGTASYFGNASFTGDSYLLGWVLPDDVARNGGMFKGRLYVRLPRMLAMTQAEWNKHYRIELYHQCWSMIHFLLHSTPQNKSAYQQYVKLIAADVEPPVAWERVFGKDTDRFGAEWEQYWARREANDVAFRQRHAVLASLSGIARVNAATGMQVKDLERYFMMAQSNQLKFKDTPETWLPIDLLNTAAGNRDRTAQWVLSYDRGNRPRLTCRLRDGTVLDASYELMKGYDRSVLSVTEPPRRGR